MAISTPAKSYGETPDPTEPTLPQPPECEVMAAMVAVPEILTLPHQWREDHNSPIELGSLQLRLMNDNYRIPCNQPPKHGEPAVQWAIRRHVGAERLIVNGGGKQPMIAPADSLWSWWREPEALNRVDKDLTDAQESLVLAVNKIGGFPSRRAILDYLSSQGEIPSEGTTNNYLAELVRRGVLVKGPGNRGFGLSS